MRVESRDLARWCPGCPSPRGRPWRLSRPGERRWADSWPRTPTEWGRTDGFPPPPPVLLRSLLLCCVPLSLSPCSLSPSPSLLALVFLFLFCFFFFFFVVPPLCFSTVPLVVYSRFPFFYGLECLYVCMHVYTHLSFWRARRSTLNDYGQTRGTS